MRVVDKQAYFQAIGYEPHPKQALYHDSQARFRIPTCGRRFGKSRMAGSDIQPKLLVPKSRFWICGPTYDLGEKEFRVIWDDLIVKRQLGRDKRVKKAYSKRSGEMFIEFPWQTRVEVRSADHPENLVGESLDGVIMSEAAKHKRETWERYIRPALADKRGFADFPTTPEGHNWLYTLWSYGRDPEFADYESWRFPSWENPYVYPLGREDPEIKLLELTTSPEWFLQEIAADFASFVGKIYPEWDELTHVEEVHYNPAWPNYIAFDWGYVNPLAAIEFQVSPNDDVYVWREHYKSYTRLEDHLMQMRDRDQPEGYRITCTYGDAADPEAVATVNRYFAPCVADPEAKKNWRAGVDCVKRFLKMYPTGAELDEFGTPQERPKMHVDHSCRSLISEFNNYKAPDNHNGKEAPATKQDDHALDALRYGLMHIFELGANAHLTDVYSESTFDSLASKGSTFFSLNERF